MADAPARRKITINTLNAKMKKGEPITQLAAYDYRTAVISDRLGTDILCVSDTDPESWPRRVKQELSNNQVTARIGYKF